MLTNVNLFHIKFSFEIYTFFLKLKLELISFHFIALFTNTIQSFPESKASWHMSDQALFIVRTFFSSIRKLPSLVLFNSKKEEEEKRRKKNNFPFRRNERTWVMHMYKLCFRFIVRQFWSKCKINEAQTINFSPFWKKVLLYDFNWFY